VRRPDRLLPFVFVFSRSSSFYELLDVAPDADRSTVMAAWMDKRRAAVSMTAMMGSDEVEAVCARLDEAFRTLTHPLRGKRYQRYHRFSRRAEAQQDEQPAPQQEVPAELPSILAVSTPTGERSATEPSDARSGWVQMSLPLLRAVDEEELKEESGSDASVSAFDELQVSSDPAAALRKREPLVTVELLDSLELLEEALSSEPGIPKMTIRLV